MSKKTRTILIFAVVLVAVFVAYFLIRSANERAEEARRQAEIEASRKIEITNVNPSSITNIAYSYQGEQLAFERSGTAWVYEDNHRFPIEQDFLFNMMSSSAKVEASRLVTEASDSFSEYGLESPVVTAEVTFATGDTKEYRFGDQNQVTEEYYFNVGGTEQVYMVDKALAETFFYKLYDLAVLDTYFTLPVDNVTAFEIIKPNETTKFVYYPEGTADVYSKDFKWVFDMADGKRPAHLTVVSSTVRNILTISGSACVDFEPTEEAIAQYGLDNPRLIVKAAGVDANGQRVTDTLYVGAETDDSEVYIQREGSDMICVANALFVKSLLENGSAHYMPDNVCLIPMNTVDSMSIVVEGDMLFDVRIENAGTENARYTVNERVVDNSLFESFYDAIYSMKTIGAADEAPQGAPTLQITFNRSTDEYAEMTLDFTPHTGSLYVARFDGRDDMLVYDWDINSITRKLHNMVSDNPDMAEAEMGSEAAE